MINTRRDRHACLRLVSSAIALAAMLTPSVTSIAQEAYDDFEIIGNMWTTPETCSWDKATPVKFSKVWSDESLNGKCVKVVGVGVWRALFDSLDGFYKL